MTRLNKILFPIITALIMLVSGLMQNACNKLDNAYMSEMDFINVLKGDWYVYNLFIETIPDNILLGVRIDVWEDSLYYLIGEDRHYYQFDDPQICSLLHINNIQDWSITESNKALFLKTTDLCGNRKEYNLNYGNYIKNAGFTDVITADISIENTDTTARMDGFIINEKTKPVSMIFDVITSSHKYSYDIRRR